jgi:hypothetical protein
MDSIIVGMALSVMGGCVADGLLGDAGHGGNMADSMSIPATCLAVSDWGVRIEHLGASAVWRAGMRRPLLAPDDRRIPLVTVGRDGELGAGMSGGDPAPVCGHRHLRPPSLRDPEDGGAEGGQ